LPKENRGVEALNAPAGSLILFVSLTRMIHEKHRISMAIRPVAGLR